jgi:2-(1,2-epoxy-1,2-dihydrophenyl)acetyl-CoA isomerase
MIIEHLIKNKKGHVLELTLNRPEAKNAYSHEMVGELVLALREADMDEDVRVVVLSAKGDSFCAGGDIKLMAEKSGMFSGDSIHLKHNYEQGIQQIPKAFRDLKKPVIAKINGASVGAGCDLTCMCDLRIASPLAKFSETFAKVGLVPGDGGAYFLIRAIGYAKAMEMFLTGKVYSAEEAKAMGLVHHVFSEDKIDEEVNNLALKLSEIPPIALQLTKKSLQYGYHQNLDEHLELMSSFQAITQRTSDHENAVGALLSGEKKIFSYK